MDVGNPCHGHEGHVVQKPPDHGINTCIVDLVDVGLTEIIIAALPTDYVPDYYES